METFAQIDDYTLVNRIKDDISNIKKELMEIKTLLELIKQKMDLDDARKKNQYIRRKIPFPFQPEQYTECLSKHS